MEVTALISAALKVLAALVPVLFFWLGYSRGKKSGYIKGVNDEIKNSDRKMAELANKLYSNPDTHFGVPDVQAWGTPPSSTVITPRMESGGNTDTVWERNSSTVSDNRGEG